MILSLFTPLIGLGFTVLVTPPANINTLTPTNWPFGKMPTREASANQNSKLKPLQPFIQPGAISIGQHLVVQHAQAIIPVEDSQATTQTATGAKVRHTITSNTNPASSAALALPAQHTLDYVLEMRVALAKSVDTLSIAMSHGGAVISLDGQALKHLDPNQAYAIAMAGDRIGIEGKSIPSTVWIQPNSGYVAVGDRWYRGRVLLLRREDGLYAINYVLLGDYLASVVGSEMPPSWPLEALQAQAVAARSYAIVHSERPAHSHYDLDNTPRYQAYTGINSETNTTQTAVKSTAGEFVSYDGGVVETLYASTQELTNSAHGGFGMSQFGARDLATQGYKHHQILGFYYPGTILQRR